MTEWVPGLDVSFSQITPAWCERRFAEGYRVAFVCLWTGGLAGNDGIKAVAENNLRTFREAGFVTGGYVNATPPDWWPLAVQMQHIVGNAGSEWNALQHVATDLEIPRLTFERASELADAIAAQGKRTEIAYSAAWFWNGHMGATTDPRWRQRFPRLWNAFYDSQPDIDFGARPYGPWSVADLVGEQYQGTTWLDGVQVDLNVFDLSYFAAQPGPAPEPTPGEEDDMPRLVRKQGTAHVYVVTGAHLESVVSEARAQALGYDLTKVEELLATHPIWDGIRVVQDGGTASDD